jgi:hypothetical protein
MYSRFLLGAQASSPPHMRRREKRKGSPIVSATSLKNADAMVAGLRERHHRRDSQFAVNCDDACLRIRESCCRHGGGLDQVDERHHRGRARVHVPANGDVRRDCRPGASDGLPFSYTVHCGGGSAREHTRRFLRAPFRRAPPLPPEPGHPRAKPATNAWSRAGRAHLVGGARHGFEAAKPGRAKRGMVSLTVASWNRIGEWLRQLDGLRQAA